MNSNPIRSRIKILIRIYLYKFESRRYGRLLEIWSCNEHLLVHLEVHLANIFISSKSSITVRIYLAKFESYVIKDKILIRIISGYFKSRRYRRFLKIAGTPSDTPSGTPCKSLRIFMKLLRDLCQIIIDNIFENTSSEY